MNVLPTADPVEAAAGCNTTINERGTVPFDSESESEGTVPFDSEEDITVLEKNIPLSGMASNICPGAGQEEQSGDTINSYDGTIQRNKRRSA